MNVPWWLLAVVGVLAIVGLFLRGLAGRVDRLNLRVDAAWEALDAQLVRRSHVVAELAGSGLLDPASALLLTDAAHGASGAAARTAREVAESALSFDLRAVLDDTGSAVEIAGDEVGHELLLDLRQACERVVLARRFHNEAVRMCQELRRRPVVRTLRLYGRSHAPTSFEIDDAPPATLPVPRQLGA